MFANANANLGGHSGDFVMVCVTRMPRKRKSPLSLWWLCRVRCPPAEQSNLLVITQTSSSRRSLTILLCQTQANPNRIVSPSLLGHIIDRNTWNVQQITVSGMQWMKVHAGPTDLFCTTLNDDVCRPSVVKPLVDREAEQRGGTFGVPLNFGC